MHLSLFVALLLVLATYVVADYHKDYLEAELSFAPIFLYGKKLNKHEGHHEVKPNPPPFTAYREDNFGWEFDALIVASLETKYFTVGNATNVENWGVHGIWEPAGAYLEPKKAPNSSIRPEWTAAVNLRNPDAKNMTLRAGIENEIVPENRSEWVDHFKSIHPDGDADFRNHEWSKHGTETPASMMQFANSLASMHELRRICANNSDNANKHGRPIAVLVRDVESVFGPVTILYKPGNGYVDCRASGIIRYDYSSSTPEANILPKLTLVEQFDG
jgi:hypothetical protein